MESSALQLTLLKDYKPSAFEIPKVELEVFIEKNFTEVHAKLTVNKVNKTASRDMVLDGEDLELLEIKINDRILATSEYLWSDNSLILKSVEDSFILETTVRIYPEKNTQLMDCSGDGKRFSLKACSLGVCSLVIRTAIYDSVKRIYVYLVRI